MTCALSRRRALYVHGAFSVIVEAREDTVRMYGDLTSNQWLNVKAVANLLLRHYPRGIIIDCTHLKEVNSDGAQTFLDAVQYIERANARIVVANLPDTVLSVLRDVPGVRSSLPVAATVDEARRSLMMGSPSSTEIPSATGGAVTLVPLIYPTAAEHATTTACRLGRESKTEIHLAYFISVPRTLPLNTPQPEEEAVAGDLLERCEAIVKRFNLRPVRHIHRTRDRAEGILQLAQSVQAETLILSRPHGMESADDITTEAVMRRAQCEVIMDQVPPNRA